MLVFIATYEACVLQAVRLIPEWKECVNICVPYKETTSVDRAGDCDLQPVEMALVRPSWEMLARVHINAASLTHPVLQFLLESAGRAAFLRL